MLTSVGSRTADFSQPGGLSPRGRFAERLKKLGRGIEIVETTRLRLRLGRRGCIFPDVFHDTRDRLNFLRIKITGCVPPTSGRLQAQLQATDTSTTSTSATGIPNPDVFPSQEGKRLT